MAANKPSIPGAVFLLLWSCAFAGGGLFLVRLGYRSLRLATAAEAAVCRVESAVVDVVSDEDGTRYSAEIAFTVPAAAGARRATAKISGAQGSRAAAQAIVARYPVGHQSPCWYDPWDPANATLERDPSRLEGILLGAVGLGFVALPLLLVAWHLGLLERSREAAAAAQRARRRAAEAGSGRDLFVGYERRELEPPLPASYGSLDGLPLPPRPRIAGQTLPVGIESDTETTGNWPIMLFALLWNAMVVPSFVALLVTGQFCGVAFLTLFLAVGACLAWLALKPYTRRLRRVPTLELEREPLAPGQPCRGIVRQPGPIHLDLFRLDYVCSERATYSEGTDTRVETRTLCEQELLLDSGVQVSATEPWCRPFELTVPAHLPGSFHAAHNRIEHQLRVSARIPRRLDIDETFTLLVLLALEESP
ncbi:MAG: DUF3592 domain-containing protein [Polyangiaceae bacterium]|nr:DUF3592 domain-containing protein [Polyangiaceae bacterium]